MNPTGLPFSEKPLTAEMLTVPTANQDISIAGSWIPEMLISCNPDL
jgi:hypothetical protein